MIPSIWRVTDYKVVDLGLTISIWVFALCVPVVIMTGSLLGVLQARYRIEDVVALFFSYILPLIAAYLIGRFRLV